MATQIKAVPAEEKPRLEAMLQDYIREMSQFTEVEQLADGRYSYPYLPLYWQVADRVPLWIEANDRYVGFALIRQDINPDDGSLGWDMAEFYIVPEARRGAIGQEAARSIWQAYPGIWYVRVLEKNKAAYPFWQKAIGSIKPRNLKEVFIQGFHQFSFSIATKK